MKPLQLFLFLLCWAFPLSAQELVETTAGPVERRTIASGASLLIQNLPDRPVAAVTLVMPWGRAHDPQACESLNKILSRCGGRPAGTLLLRLEEMGGLTSYQTGQSWSSFTLVVPRGYAGWATQVQLDRLAGQWLQGEDLSGLLSTYGAPANLDPTRLRSLFTQHWNPAQGVLSLVGGYEQAEITSILSKVPPVKAGQPGPAAGAGEFLPGRLGWSYARPTQAQQRAAAWLWRTALRSQDKELQLDLSPAQDEYWLSCSTAKSSVEAARQRLSGAGADSGLLVTIPLRQLAVRDWLEERDDLGERSNLLAFEQAQGELGQDLKTLEALKAYDPLLWKADMAWTQKHGEGLPVTLAAPTKNAGSSLKPKASPAPPAATPVGPPAFVRLEPTPGSSVLIQAVPDLPIVAIRAVLPGGSSCDAAALAGRAEWLAAYWQAGFEPELATRVEAQPYGWQFSAYLPREQASAWVSKWIQTWSTNKFDPLLAARCQPTSNESISPLQQGYREWLRLLFPPDHPLGREGQRVALAPERLQELQNEVRQRGRWNLFLSGGVNSNELSNALSAVPAAGEPWNHIEALATSEQKAPVVLPADVPRCTLLVGGYGPSRRDADYYAFVLLLQALAADPLRSRLQMELRLKQPLAERVDCSFLSSTGVAPWLLRIDCPAENLAQVQTRLKEQLDALRSKEVSAEELRLAVSRLEGQQQVACKNSTGLVLQLRNLELFRLSDSYNQGFAGIYHNVSVKDVLASARLRLAPDRMVTLVLTPKS